MFLEVIMQGVYDIYIVADVEELKRKYDKLRRMWRELVHENALLHARINSLERAEVAKCL